MKKRFIKTSEYSKYGIHNEGCHAYGSVMRDDYEVYDYNKIIVECLATGHMTIEQLTSMLKKEGLNGLNLEKELKEFQKLAEQKMQQEQE